jgi:hypothetical protein
MAAKPPGAAFKELSPYEAQKRIDEVPVAGVNMWTPGLDYRAGAPDERPAHSCTPLPSASLVFTLRRSLASRFGCPRRYAGLLLLRWPFRAILRSVSPFLMRARVQGESELANESIGPKTLRGLPGHITHTHEAGDAVMVKWDAMEGDCGWYRIGAYGCYHLKVNDARSGHGWVW